MFFCYNIQPSIEIDYATGDSKMIENADANSVANETEDAETDFENTEMVFILNANTKRFTRLIAKALKQSKRIIKLNTQEQ